MKEIELTRDKIALIDDEDFELISKYSWWAYFDGYNWYARTAIKDFSSEKYKQKYFFMHRLILDFPSIRIDHIDHNGLNNQKENLRLATNQQNSFNKRKQKNTSSRYKGVSLDKETQKWRACIKYNGKTIHLGSHFTEIDAAKIYNQKATELFKEFAWLNKI